jgi:hypothetical protein
VPRATPDTRHSRQLKNEAKYEYYLLLSKGEKASSHNIEKTGNKL